MIPTADIFFAGADLIGIGFEQAGIPVRKAYELDRIACATMRLNFPRRQVVEGDLARMLGKEAAGADIMVFTYPCTRYSTIGDIHGVRTGDELYLHALRMLALNPPEAFVIENVPGMLKFPVVMEAMTALPDYYCQVFCPIGSQLWLPQRRDRLIVLCTRRPFGFRAPEGTRALTLAEILEADPQVEIPAYVWRRLAGKYRDLPIISDPAAGDIAPTCVAHYAKDLSTRLVRDPKFPQGVRPYTVREYARLQGVPDWFQFAGTPQDAYRQIGNGVSVPVGRWIATELLRYFNHCRDRKVARSAAARRAWATARAAA